MQLVANGSQDIYLTGNPEMTYFRAVYRRHTNFAKESILQNTIGTLHQGSKFSVIIGRHGDLLTDVHVVIKRKTFEVAKNKMKLINSAWDCSGNFYYPSAGYNFLDYVEVEIGGQVIDKHYGDWLNIWTDLTEPADKKIILNQMLYGKTRLMHREADIFKDGDIYIPLKFWFCTNPGLALPLIALQYHEVKLNFSLTPSCFSSESIVYMDTYAYGSVSADSNSKHVVSHMAPQQEVWRGFARVTGGGEAIKKLNTPYAHDNVTPVPEYDATNLLQFIKEYNSVSGLLPADLIKSYETYRFVEKGVLAGTNKVKFYTKYVSELQLAAPSPWPDVDPTLFDIVSPPFLENKVAIPIPKETNIIDELSVYADYIFLDTAERKKFAKVKHEYLFEQIQTQGPSSISTTTQREAIDLRFNHPIKEIIWTLDDGPPNTCAPSCSSKKFEIVKAALLQLNGKDRFQKRNGSYFTLAQRYQHHSGTPLKYLFEALYSGDLYSFKKNWDEFTGSSIPSEAIHLYSFALNPEKNIPSGTCNFSRLDNVVLELEFFSTASADACVGSSRPCYYDTPSNRTLWVYGINYNVLRIMGGMGGLVYCN